MWWLYILIGIIGVFLGILTVAMGISTIGTLYVDLNAKDDKDIARFIFDFGLDEIAGKGLVFVRIKRKEGLSSLDGKL